jgi:hypothetical protein
VERISNIGQNERGWSRASFRIFGETLVPEELGAALDIVATKTHIKGQRHSGSRGVWRDSAWLLCSPLQKHESLTEHLKWLLDRLEPKTDVIKAIAKKYRVDIFCGFSSGSGQGGFTIDVETLGRLANLGIPVGLDLYPLAAVENGESQENLNAAVQ